MSTPSRLREQNFRRFEQSFDTALKQYPHPIIIEIPDLSPRTIAARCRDAMLSHQQFKWTAPFHYEATKRLKVYEKGNIIWLGGKDPEDKPSPEAAQIVLNNSTPEWTEAEIRALALLLSSAKIQGPITLNQVVDPLLISHLESSFNVSLTPQPDGTTLIL